jgi:hypothetical protein
MKSSSFIKMLQKANIQISTTDADILFKQFASKRSMTFEPFVKCLEHLATTLFPDSKAPLNKLAEQLSDLDNQVAQSPS